MAAHLIVMAPGVKSAPSTWTRPRAYARVRCRVPVSPNVVRSRLWMTRETPSPEMKWSSIESTLGSFNFGPADAEVGVAVKVFRAGRL